MNTTDDRQARLAAALRANLRRRKAHGREEPEQAPEPERKDEAE